MQWSGVEWPGVPILGEEQDLCTHTTPIHTRQTVGHQLLRLLDRVVLTYSGTGSQPGGVDALLNHFARNDEGTIRSVLPGEHASKAPFEAFFQESTHPPTGTVWVV